MIYSTDRSKAVVPVLVLLLVALWFILRGDLLYVFPCVIFTVFKLFFNPFSIAITSLWEERVNLSSFRTFVLVWICRFPLPLGIWEGLRFLIVFSYLFFETSTENADAQLNSGRSLFCRKNKTIRRRFI